MPGPAVQSSPDPVQVGNPAAEQARLDHVCELHQARSKFAVERAEQPGGFDIPVGPYTYHPVADPTTDGAAFVDYRDRRHIPLD